MKVVIFGATGGTGTELVRQALEQGHAVTAFVRNPARQLVKDEHLRVVTGDIFDPGSVAQAIQGQEAVICALGSRDLKKTSIRATGTINIIGAMKKHNVRRLIVISAMGVGESWDSLSALNKFFFATLLKSAREDHQAQETAVKESGLDWTIIRPSGLIDSPRSGTYNVGENIRAKTSKISRADVAALSMSALEDRSLVHKAVIITN
ncbi:MAG: SDR family oxidoreductase [Anaerolineales bacterium]